MPTDVLALFGSCVKVGLLAFGGGNSAIPLLESEVVPRWLTTQEYAELVGLNFGLPGISMIKLAGMIGLRVAGIWGLLAAIVGLALPGLLLTIAAAKLLGQNRDHWLVARVLTAMRYAAVALLLSSALKMVPGLSLSPAGFAASWIAIAFIAAVFIAVHQFKLNPALAILASMGVGVLVLGSRAT